MSTANKKTTEKTGEPVEQAFAAGQETLETVFKAGAEAASEGVEKAISMSQEHAAAAINAGADAFKGYEDVVSYGKDNVDAVMKSNAIFVKGVQDINKALFGLAQASLEESLTATQKILGCKTAKEAMAAQAALARVGYDKAVQDSRKITDLSVKLAEEASQPIAKQVNATIEKFTKPIAA